MAELDDIFAGRETAPVEAKEPVAKEQTETVPQEAEREQSHEAESESPTVPVAALQKEREKAKRYTEEVADMRRQMAESDAKWQARFEQLVSTIRPPQPQAEQPVDFWENPEAVIDSRVTQVKSAAEQEIAAVRENFSKMMAEDKHGRDVVQGAYESLAGMKGQPGFDVVYRQIMSSPHPYGTLVEWHKKSQTLAKIGDDPDAFIEAEIARRMAEMQANGGGQPAANAPAAAMPSNFATARNVGARSGPSWSGPTPLADIFKR